MTVLIPGMPRKFPTQDYGIGAVNRGWRKRITNRSINLVVRITSKSHTPNRNTTGRPLDRERGELGTQGGRELKGHRGDCRVTGVSMDVRTLGG